MPGMGLVRCDENQIQRVELRDVAAEIDAYL